MYITELYDRRRFIFLTLNICISADEFLKRLVMSAFQQMNHKHQRIICCLGTTVTKDTKHPKLEGPPMSEIKVYSIVSNKSP